MGTGLGTGMGSNWELEALWNSMGRSGMGRFAINLFTWAPGTRVCTQAQASATFVLPRVWNPSPRKLVMHSHGRLPPSCFPRRRRRRVWNRSPVELVSHTVTGVRHFRAPQSDVAGEYGILAPTVQFPISAHSSSQSSSHSSSQLVFF